MIERVSPTLEYELNSHSKERQKESPNLDIYSILSKHLFKTG